jgi:hypothetical protein
VRRETYKNGNVSLSNSHQHVGNIILVSRGIQNRVSFLGSFKLSPSNFNCFTLHSIKTKILNFNCWMKQNKTKGGMKSRMNLNSKRKRQILWHVLHRWCPWCRHKTTYYDCFVLLLVHIFELYVHQLSQFDICYWLWIVSLKKIIVRKHETKKKQYKMLLCWVFLCVGVLVCESYKMLPQIVDFPASTCPMNTKLMGSLGS